MEYQDLPKAIESTERAAKDAFSFKSMLESQISGGNTTVKVNSNYEDCRLDPQLLLPVVAERLKSLQIKLEALKENHETLTKVAKGLL